MLDNAAMTTFEQFADNLNNRRDKENIPHFEQGSAMGETPGREPINLGSDPGALLATLPALLGFVPEQSLVVVGLVPSSCTTLSRMTVGPVVRVDFHREAVREGVETLIEAIRSTGSTELSDCEAVLIGIGASGQKRSRALSQARGILEEHNVTINGHFLVKQLVSGARWREINTNTFGYVGDVDDNPVQNIATLAGAVRMRDRTEMEHWLDEEPEALDLVATRCMLGCDAQKVVACAEEGHGLCVQRSAGVEDVIDFYTAVADIVDGERSLEEASTDVHLLTQIAYIALSDVLHPTLIVAGAGAHAAIVRDLLASAARRCRGTSRWRIMAILSMVLGGNDEGTLAFATLMRTMNELETVGEENSITAALTLSAIGAHHRGKSRDFLYLALNRGVQVLAACHDDLHLAVDLGAKVEELLYDFDACLDILDIAFLRRAGAFDQVEAGPMNRSEERGAS